MAGGWGSTETASTTSGSGSDWGATSDLASALRATAALRSAFVYGAPVRVAHSPQAILLAGLGGELVRGGLVGLDTEAGGADTAAHLGGGLRGHGDISSPVTGNRSEAAHALAFCGLRAAEILMLAWADLDEGRTVATIRYQLAGSGPKATRVQRKTAASEQPVPLPPFVTSRLAASADAHRQVGMARPEGLEPPTL